MSVKNDKQIKLAFIKKVTTKRFKEYLSTCKIDKANLSRKMVSSEKIDHLFELVLKDVIDYANEGMQIKSGNTNNDKKLRLDQKEDTKNEKQDHGYIEHEM